MYYVMDTLISGWLSGPVKNRARLSEVFRLRDGASNHKMDCVNNFKYSKSKRASK